MEITLNLEPEAVQAARELAAERQQSVAEFVSGAILRERGRRLPPVGKVVIDEHGWPVVRTGRPITAEEVRAIIAEDED